jgi:hypothetical protein
MPPAGPLWNINWLNANSQRKYPIFEEAGLMDETDTFEIPNDLIVDLIWPVHLDATIDQTLFHIKAISIFGAGVTISLGYNGDTIGSVSIDAASFTTNQAFLIQGTGQFYDTIGKIVIGSLDTILESAGSFQFDVANARLEPTVIKPDIRGVNAIYIRNGDETSDAIQGDVILQAGRNFLINFVAGAIGEPDRIVLSAIEGAGLNEDCECGEAANRPCIKTIGGIGPDSNGDFSLVEDDCIKLDAIANGLKIRDDCSKPCCGCDELQVVLDTTAFVQDQLVSLQTLATRIEAKLNAMETNLMASKTGTTSP